MSAARFKILFAIDEAAHRLRVPYAIQRRLCLAVERAAGAPDEELVALSALGWWR